MAESKATGTLRLFTDRAGTVAEISQFLVDLETAYLALYDLDSAWASKLARRDRRFFMEPGFTSLILGGLGIGALTPDTVLPEDRLFVKSVRIESPGFWEVAASFNPLQQIREYLNDRHKRRQDKEFREGAEREKLLLENELVQQ